MSNNTEYIPQRLQLENMSFALHCAYKEIDSLRSALEMYEVYMSVMQKDAETYLTPNSDATVTEMFRYKSDEWFVSRMLEHLDGPMQREVQSAARKVLKETLRHR